MAKSEKCPPDEEVEESSGFFKAAYKTWAPWDIGRPQQAFVRLEASGQIKGSILDVGCGTGENSLFFASKGHDVVGIDLVENAIKKARAKAEERGIKAEFRILSAFKLERLGRSFDNVIDSGLFHIFSDDDRACFAGSLAEVLRPGGLYFMLGFSDKGKGRIGPRRLSQEEIRSSFSNSWNVKEIRETFFEDRVRSRRKTPAWLATIERL